MKNICSARANRRNSLNEFRVDEDLVTEGDHTDDFLFYGLTTRADIIAIN